MYTHFAGGIKMMLQKLIARVFRMGILCALAFLFLNASSDLQQRESDETIASATAIARNDQSGENWPTPFQDLFSLDRLIRPVLAAEGPCSPNGDPITNGRRYQGDNSFYLCREQHMGRSGVWGEYYELDIACKASSLRSGWKWRIWCNANGTNCACNKDDFIGGNSNCCNFTAGSHCTAPGGARPGQNGCASW